MTRVRQWTKYIVMECYGIEVRFGIAYNVFSKQLKVGGPKRFVEDMDALAADVLKLDLQKAHIIEEGSRVRYIFSEVDAKRFGKLLNRRNADKVRMMEVRGFRRLMS